MKPTLVSASFLMLLPCLTLTIQAQELVNEEIISAMTIDINTGLENIADLETLTDRLYELEEDPVRLNLGTRRETGRLFFLSESQIKALTDYIRLNGKIISVHEISGINGFDRETVSMMEPFITLGYPAGSRLGRSRRVSQVLLNNFSVKQGVEDPDAPGSQWKVLTKYRLAAGALSAGLTAEKDAGEKYLGGKPRLPDFFSGHLCYNGNGFIQKVVAGDFTARFGMGSVINTGFRSGLSVSSPGSLVSACELRPYTSTEENNYFRGAAVILGNGRVETTLFASYNAIDATIITEGGNSNPSVKTLHTTGLHNTASSLQKKDALKEFCWGINIAGYFKTFSVGLIATENIFSLPFTPDRSSPESLFDFSGRRNTLGGFWYSLGAGRLILSGEAASGRELKPALTQSVIIVPGDRISFSFLYRYYSPAFTSFHGKGVFSGSVPSNEEALLGNVRFEAAKYLFISAGSEVRKHPQAKYLKSFPSLSVLSEARVSYLPVKFSVEAVYRYKSSGSDLKPVRGVPGIEELITSSLTLKVKYPATDYLSLATRADVKTCQGGKETGIMLSQDVLWKSGRTPVRVWLRHALFSTGGWDTRIYAYENDLLNSFSIPALSGRGSRTYVMAEWRPAKKVMLRAKYGVTSKISSPGNGQLSEELKFQLKISL